MSRAELQSVRESVGRLSAESTYYNLSHSDKNLREFVEDKGLQDMPISTITEDLFEEYRFFLKKRGLKGSTINNNLCWLSRLMYRAVSQRIIRCNPFENAKYEKTEQKIRFLQKSDVAKLMALKVNDKEAEQARLMFVFSCFTGMAIADMENLEYRTYPNGSGRTKVHPQGTVEDKGGVCRAFASDSGGHHQSMQERTTEHERNADSERKRRRLYFSLCL